MPAGLFMVLPQQSRSVAAGRAGRGGASAARRPNAERKRPTTTDSKDEEKKELVQALQLYPPASAEKKPE
ncbi:hypothetical protein H4217_009268, partial [Coemansia sp. RSA 1939]